MITHVPMHLHPNPKTILVIGGGDGGTVREVLRHPSVEKCTMVEIDSIVVEAAKKFIPQTSCQLDNVKVQLKIADGVDFVKTCQEKFDVVIIDSSDPIGPATPLFNIDFYKNVANILNENGIVVSQGETPFYEMEMQKKLVEIKSQVFKKVHVYNYCNMSYPSGLWTFTYASNEICPFEDFKAEKISENFKYYNSQIHIGAFLIPEFQKQALGKYLTPLPKIQLP